MLQIVWIDQFVNIERCDWWSPFLVRASTEHQINSTKLQKPNWKDGKREINRERKISKIEESSGGSNP